MANELYADVTPSSTGNVALITNPDNAAQAWDATAGAWAAYDPADSDQQIALGSGVAIDSDTERQFANRPAGLAATVVYPFDVFDSAGDLVGSGTTAADNVSVTYQHQFNGSKLLLYITGNPASVLVRLMRPADGRYYDYVQDSWEVYSDGYDPEQLTIQRNAINSTTDSRPIEWDFALFPDDLDAGDYVVQIVTDDTGSADVLHALELHWDETSLWASETAKALAAGGEIRTQIAAAGSTVDAEIVSGDRTWRLTQETGSSRSHKFVRVKNGFAGTLQVDYSHVLDGALAGPPAVTIGGAATVTPTDVRLHVSKTASLIDVPTLDTLGTYTVRVVAQTVDSQTIPSEHTLVVE